MAIERGDGGTLWFQNSDGTFDEGDYCMYCERAYRKWEDKKWATWSKLCKPCSKKADQARELLDQLSDAYVDAVLKGGQDE